MTQRIFYAACSVLGAAAVFTTVWWPWHWDRLRDTIRRWNVELEDKIQRNTP